MEDVKANIKRVVGLLECFHSPTEGRGGFEQGDLMTVLLATGVQRPVQPSLHQPQRCSSFSL